MPSDIIEPGFGPSIPDKFESEPPPPQNPPPLSTSSDELTASLIQARPDPLLGEFKAEASPEAIQAESETPPPPADEPDATRADAMNALASLHVNADDLAVANVEALPDSALGDPLTGLDLTMPNISAHPVTGPAVLATTPSGVSTPEQAEDDDDEPASGMSLGTLLLFSYASAVTLGRGCGVWTGRRIREDVADVVPAADTRPDPGQRAGLSRRITPPKPIPTEHLVELGKTIRVGQIEATPLALASGPVELERNFTQRETKAGGANALKLKLRLRNVSRDLVLAPFDEAFVRERVNADPDTFIEPAKEGETIAMFALAVESEWSIVGQSFRELKPGETLDTIVVSAPDTASKLAPAMTWRIRLRTDLNHTDDLGVRFRVEDVKPGS